MLTNAEYELIIEALAKLAKNLRDDLYFAEREVRELSQKKEEQK